MLRRLSDVTIGSIEKLLKIGVESEKKRKLVVSECEEDDEFGDQERENILDKEVN